MMDIEFEDQLRKIAETVEYPRTPDIAESVMTRLHSTARPRFTPKRLAWSLTFILVLLSSLMLIPPVRAAVIEFIQIGIVRIFPRPVEPTVETVPPEPAGIVSPATATPDEPFTPLFPLPDDLAGETNLANATQIANYPILLPTYPAELGPPDRVYIQDVESVMTVLVWMDPQQTGRVAMSLHFIPSGSWAVRKFDPVAIRETKINGQRAVWTEGPYPLILRNGNIEYTRLIDGHVLIWADGEITYRLETDLQIEEAIKIAESLEPGP